MESKQENAKWWHFLIAVLIPIAGFIAAIIFFARGNASQGVALLLTSALGVFLTLALIGGGA